MIVEPLSTELFSVHGVTSSRIGIFDLWREERNDGLGKEFSQSVIITGTTVVETTISQTSLLFAPLSRWDAIAVFL